MFFILLQLSSVSLKLTKAFSCVPKKRLHRAGSEKNYNQIILCISVDMSQGCCLFTFFRLRSQSEYRNKTFNDGNPFLN